MTLFITNNELFKKDDLQRKNCLKTINNENEEVGVTINNKTKIAVDKLLNQISNAKWSESITNCPNCKLIFKNVYIFNFFDKKIKKVFF